MDIKTLIKLLPHGYSSIVCKEFGIKPNYLSNMLHGHSALRLDVAEYLIEMAEEYRQYKEDLEKRIDKL